MTEKIRGVLNTERDATGKFVWVVTAVEGDIGSMPRIERSDTSYATEEEALAAGRECVDEMRRD